MTWRVGESLTVEKISMPFAQYRVTSAGQSIPNNTVTAIQFGTAVATTSLVVPGGTGNSYFTLQPGLWSVDASHRLGGTVTDVRLYVYLGTTHTTAGTIQVAEGRLNTCISHTFELLTASAVGIGVYQNSGGARTVDKFGDVPQVVFVREEHR